MRILTWHVHGNYLYYLSHIAHDLYLPVRSDRTDRMGYSGCAPGFPWPSNVHDVPVEQVRDLQLDCILFQSKSHFLEDRNEILSESQRRLPYIYLEHDPPQEHPTDTRHVVDDPDALLVHVTSFNDLMWDSGRTPTRVIEHGVPAPEGVRYSGELEKGLVVVNNLKPRGRRLGWDVFERIRTQVPLDLIGMGSEEIGGLGEISHEELPAFMCRYRFIFNPIRYTSLGLAICEAMSLGIPVVGLATTEMVTAVTNDVTGYVDTDLDRLVCRMRALLDDPHEAHRLGCHAMRTARDRFALDRFARDWDQACVDVVCGRARSHHHPEAFAGRSR